MAFAPSDRLLIGVDVNAHWHRRLLQIPGQCCE
jgi:hypothetical protein